MYVVVDRGERTYNGHWYAVSRNLNVVNSPLIGALRRSERAGWSFSQVVCPCETIILPSSSLAASHPSLQSTTMNLSAHHVAGSDETFYISEFVTGEEEAYLIRKVRP